MRPFTVRGVAPSLAVFLLGLAVAVAGAGSGPGWSGAQQTATAATPPAPDGDGVLLIGGATTREAFVKGRPLIETAATRCTPAARDAPGIAEVHASDTDIFYVLDGTATLVTGGRTVDAKSTAPDEIRGPRSMAARRARSPKATS